MIAAESGSRQHQSRTAVDPRSLFWALIFATAMKPQFHVDFYQNRTATFGAGKDAQ